MKVRKLIKKIILILDLCIFCLLYPNYKIIKGKIFFKSIPVFREDNLHYNKSIPADVDSFKIINNRYAKDKYSAYFMEQYIKNSDVGSFTPIGRGISKDKNNVYKYWLILKDIDVATIKVFNEELEDYDNSYIQDKNGIYFVTIIPFGDIFLKKIENIDSKSFQELYSGYAKDKKNIFYKIPFGK